MLTTSVLFITKGDKDKLSLFKLFQKTKLNGFTENLLSNKKKKKKMAKANVLLKLPAVYVNLIVDVLFSQQVHEYPHGEDETGRS